MPRIHGLSTEDLDALLELVGDLVVSIGQAIRKAVAGLFGASAPSADALGVVRSRWTKAVDAEILPALAEVYTTSAQATAKGLSEAGRDVEDLSAPDAADFLAVARNRLVGVGDERWEAARDVLADGVRSGQDMEVLAERVADAAQVSEARALVIARTEVLAAHNAAALAQARVLDDPAVVKEWLSTPDDRTRPEHKAADGQRVRIGDKFEVGGAKLDFPGDPNGPPELVIACRCSIAIDLDDEPTVAAATDLHLPGVHDQSKHGGTGGTNAPSVKSEATPVPKKSRKPRDTFRIPKPIRGVRKIPLEKSVASGLWGSEPLPGGKIAETNRVSFGDGTLAVQKISHDVGHHTATDQADAEYLGALTVRALGGKAPQVVLVDDDAGNQVFMEFMLGTVAVRKFPTHSNDPDEADRAYVEREAAEHSDDAYIIGLADVMMNHEDRNPGNWLVDDKGRLQAIDHGFAFDWAQADPQSPPGDMGFNNLYRATDYAYGNSKWKDNDLSPRDVAKVRSRFQALLPEFERLGHADWHRFALYRLENVGRHAKGRRSRIK